MTTQPISSVPGDVTDFVTQVRAALADLPPDEVDELTAGLAADLADARAEAPGSWREGVGSPSAYAAELRTAAGLPAAHPIAPVTQPSALDRAVEAWRTSSLHPVARRWYDELRPGGWVLRGLIATWFLAGSSLLTIVLVGLPLVALSVWIGLQARRGNGWARLVGGTGAGVAFFLGLAISASLQANAEPSYGYDPYVEPGPSNAGTPVQNFYGFDAGGQRVDGLRLFDQDGNPVRTQDFNGVEIGAFPGITDPGLQSDPWAGSPELSWVPPMTIPPAIPAPAGEATSTESSTSSSDPTSSADPTSTSSSSTSGSSSSSTSRSDDEQESPSPRATSTSR